MYFMNSNGVQLMTRDSKIHHIKLFSLTAGSGKFSNQMKKSSSEWNKTMSLHNMENKQSKRVFHVYYLWVIVEIAQKMNIS